MSKDILRSIHDLIEVMSKIFERTSNLLGPFVATLILDRADWMCSREIHLSGLVKVKDDSLNFEKLFEMLPERKEDALRYLKHLIVSYVQVVEKLIPKEHTKDLVKRVSISDLDMKEGGEAE
jgi:hypothetical protein